MLSSVRPRRRSRVRDPTPERWPLAAGRRRRRRTPLSQATPAPSLSPLFFPLSLPFTLPDRKTKRRCRRGQILRRSRPLLAVSAPSSNGLAPASFAPCGVGFFVQCPYWCAPNREEQRGHDDGALCRRARGPSGESFFCLGIFLSISFEDFLSISLLPKRSRPKPCSNTNVMCRSTRLDPLR